MNAVKQLSEDVRALRLEVTHLRRHHDRSAPQSSHCTGPYRVRPDSPDRTWHERGRDRQRSSPHVSPARHSHSSASSHHDSTRPSGNFPQRSYSHGYHGRHYSPSPPSTPPSRREFHSTGSYGRSHYSPDPQRYSSGPGSGYPDHRGPHRHSNYSTPEPGRHRYGSHSTYSSRERRPLSRERDHHVSFDEDISRQGNAW